MLDENFETALYANWQVEVDLVDDLGQSGCSEFMDASSIERLKVPINASI